MVFHFFVDDFSREDLAAAYLNVVTSDICQLIHNACIKEDINNVFFCGSFMKAEIVRRHLTLEFRRRAMSSSIISQKVNPTVMYFNITEYFYLDSDDLLE